MIRHFVYCEKSIEELSVHPDSICDVNSPPGFFHWIDITGATVVAELDAYLKNLQLHPVLVEQLTDFHSRPVVDDFDSCLFVSLKTMHADNETKHISHQQINMILGSNFLITTHEQAMSCTRTILDKLQSKAGLLRYKGSDYMAFYIIDIIVDEYYRVLDVLEDKSDALEERVLQQKKDFTFDEFNMIKRDLLYFRKIAVPLRDALGLLVKGKASVIDNKIFPYYSDVRQNVVAIIDSIEARIEIMYSQLDIHNSIMSNRLNSIMKVLTVITAIFIPLSFITGLYGMNFASMPLLHSPSGFWIVTSCMALIFIGMMFYFYWKKWL